MTDLKKYDVQLTDQAKREAELKESTIYNLPVFNDTPGLEQAFAAVLYNYTPADHALVSRKFLGIDIEPLNQTQKKILLRMFRKLNPPIIDANKIQNEQTKTIWIAAVQKKISELQVALGQETQQPTMEMDQIGGRKRRRPRSKRTRSRSKTRAKSKQRR